MSGPDFAAAPAPVPPLACPLPAPTSDEPQELRTFRGNPDDERTFLKLRRDFRNQENWRALATLLVLRASVLPQPGKAAELAVQAYELWLERVKDRTEAAHALARAVLLQPDNLRVLQSLLKLYDGLGWHADAAAVLRWQIERGELDPARGHLELAKYLEDRLIAIAEAVDHYRISLEADPTLAEASEQMVRLHLEGGAWSRATELLLAELEHLTPDRDPERVALLRRRLARIDAEEFENLASAARHLQAALQAKPDDIDALQAFGNLYLGSGKATEEGKNKAADIFFKAAELARRHGKLHRGRRLLERALALRPGHDQAVAVLEQTLIEVEDWVGLDRLYRDELHRMSGPEAVPVLLRRAALLENHLGRREEARALYEESANHQQPGTESWVRLKQIYEEAKEYYPLVGVLEAEAERRPTEVPTETLLRAAQIFREELGNEERAAVFYYKVLEREPFDAVAFEGYKEHWRRKHNWGYLRDLILYQIEQASADQGPSSPLRNPLFAEEFVELADICERRLGDVDGALDAWGRMAAAFPADPRPRESIARIEKRGRMWDRMIRVHEAELERATAPEQRLDILRRLSQVYRDRQVNPERAIQLYEEILRLAPTDVQTQRALTALYDRSGDHEKVYDLLREQYERSRSNTERVALLRRMAEICHHDLQRTQDAIWACDQILSHLPTDRAALHQLQNIYADEGNAEALATTLERELKIATDATEKTKLLRRIARVVERDIHDRDRAADVWGELLKLQPTNLDVIDRMLVVYEQAGRVEDAATLLNRTADSSKTPVVRQKDYLLRLGRLAESALEDPDMARSAYERVLRLSPDEDESLEALVRIYRQEKAWGPLSEILSKLQQRADTPDDGFRYAWERAEVLADRLDQPGAAADVLEELGIEILAGHSEVIDTLRDLYDRSHRHRKLVRQAEVMLLAATAADERRRLYGLISDAWLRHLGERQAALSAYRRFVEEFPDDVDGLWTLANLQEEVGDHEGALHSLEHRVELSADPHAQIHTLMHMSSVAERRAQDPRRALLYLRRALSVDPTDEAAMQRIDEIVQAHELWAESLDIADTRFDQMAQREDPQAQIDICLAASKVAEERMGDPHLAFNWARRAYFAGRSGGEPLDTSYDRLEQLAQSHNLWTDMIDLHEQEIALLQAEHADPDQAIGRLLAAADIAEGQLQDATRAVELLRRAHDMRPDDDSLAERLERTARAHELWEALVELYLRRLERVETALGRLDAYLAIARVYEESLGKPQEAFTCLRTAWAELRSQDGALAEEVQDRMVDLVRAHGLWRELAGHHVERARQSYDRDDHEEAREALTAAADVLENELSDPFAAIRVLAFGVEHDADASSLMARIRDLGSKLDREGAAGTPALGALAQLVVLERAYELAHARDARVDLLEERARLREERLDDGEGAMAEWLRVIELDRNHPEATAQLHRIAEARSSWNVSLAAIGTDLEHSSEHAEQRRLYLALAEIYENRLERPEYALRARIEAWRRAPSLPSSDQPQDEHAMLWRLAAEAGEYERPPVPRDPLLWPTILAPEIQDRELWRRLHRDPDQVLRLDLDDDGVIRAEVAPQTTEEVDLQAIEGTDVGRVEEVEELVDELEELEELDELDEAPASPPALRAGPPTPPPLRRPRSELPALPTLAGAVLPPRPRIPSGWAELAVAYADAPTANKQEKIDVALAIARMWEDGARDVERAFFFHEQALILVPEHPTALRSLQALAERHDASERLVRAYERLLGEASLPDHLVAIGMRTAALHEARFDPDRAEDCYRSVLVTQPAHVGALEALARIYEDRQRHGDWAQVFAELLEVQFSDLEQDERVARTLRLAQVLENDIGNRDEAIEHLERITRLYPHRLDLHEALTNSLLAGRHWQKAVDALRTASESVDDEAFQVRNLARIAEVYEQHLRLANRALEAWLAILERRPDHEQALVRVQELYTAAGQHDRVLPIIDRRLGSLDAHDLETRVNLLVAKARILQETGDVAGAATNLERLIDELPDNDEVVLALARLRLRAGDTERGLAVLQDRIDHLPRADVRRLPPLVMAMVEAMRDEAHDLDRALATVQAALKQVPGDVGLVNLRTELARAARRWGLLCDSLVETGDPARLLEAARIAATQLDDRARAKTLFAKALGQAKAAPDAPGSANLVAGAVEGLVRMRIEDADAEGAIAFMDREIAEVSPGGLRARLLAEMGRITYRTTRDVTAARARFSAALKEQPDLVAAKIGLGELLLEVGDTHEAERLASDAVETAELQDDEDGLVRSLVLLATVLERTDRAGEAFRRLTMALRRAPDNLEIRGAIVRNRFDAKRWRDVVTAVEQLDKRLVEGFEIPPQHARLVSSMFAMAGAADTELKNAEGVLAHYRRAVEVDPTHAGPLATFAELLRDAGRPAEAARCLEQLAGLAEDDAARTRRFADAAILYREAATESELERETAVGSTEALTKSALDNLRKAVTLAERFDRNAMATGQLEAGYELAVEHGDARTALRCLELLLGSPRLEAGARLETLLAGIELARSLEEEDGMLAKAKALAVAAHELAPESPRAVMVLADVLEALGETTAIERLVAGFFSRPDRAADDRADRETQAALLIRLSRLQQDTPEAAITSLEHAAKLAPETLSPDVRRRMADLYARAGVEGDKVLSNYEALLAHEPLDVPSLVALASQARATGDLDRAWALYRVLRLADPGDLDAERFLEEHGVLSGNPGAFDAGRAVPSADSGAGIADALEQMWAGAAGLLADHLPRIEVPNHARISPVGEGPLAKSWSEVLRKLGQTKVALVDGEATAIPALTNGHGGHQYFTVHAQHPPVIVVTAQGKEASDPDELRFSLGRALYFTRPEAVLAAGLPSETLAVIVSALLQAFHPRHARRKHYSGEDESVRLSQDLARKLPVRLARQIGQAFKDHEAEPFDSRTWRSWIERAGNRVGLVVSGDIEAAVRVVCGRPDLRGEALSREVGSDTGLRDLLAFATSPGYVAARRDLGFVVQAGET